MNRILASLQRQQKGLDLLYSLLKEEYKILCSNNKKELSKNQFAIQKLISQLEREKRGLLNLMEKEFKVKRLEDMLKILSREERVKVSPLIERIKRTEKICMEQATQNADLAMAHLEQTRELVNFLYEQIRPKAKDVYSRYGMVNAKTTGPCLVSGRL